MFEIRRKLVHFLGLSVPILYYFTSRETVLILVGIAVVCAIFIEVGRFTSERFYAVISGLIDGYAREHEQVKVTGATYYAIAAFCAVSLFEEEVAVLSLLFLTLGDSFAALVGTRWGKHKIFEKSLEGSSACFLVCLPVGWALLGWVGLLGSVAATMIEVVPVPVDDNLRIPLVSGSLMQAALIFLSENVFL